MAASQTVFRFFGENGNNFFNVFDVSKLVWWLSIGDFVKNLNLTFDMAAIFKMAAQRIVSISSWENGSMFLRDSLWPTLFYDLQLITWNKKLIVTFDLDFWSGFFQIAWVIRL